jgi:hypothetical protein
MVQVRRPDAWRWPQGERETHDNMNVMFDGHPFVRWCELKWMEVGVEYTPSRAHLVRDCGVRNIELVVGKIAER